MGTSNVFAIKSKENLLKDLSVSQTCSTTVDRTKLQEMLLETAIDLDYEDFTKETGLFISDIELLKADEEVYIEWFLDQSFEDETMIWEFYFNFLFERYQEEIDPWEVFSNPFLSYNANWLSNK